jgi:hypothetical protein
MYLLLSHSVTHNGAQYQPGLHDTTNWPQGQAELFLTYKWSVKEYNPQALAAGNVKPAADAAQRSFEESYREAQQKRTNVEPRIVPQPAVPVQVVAPAATLPNHLVTAPQVKVKPFDPDRLPIPGPPADMEPLDSDIERPGVVRSMAPAPKK